MSAPPVLITDSAGVFADHYSIARQQRGQRERSTTTTSGLQESYSWQSTTHVFGIFQTIDHIMAAEATHEDLQRVVLRLHAEVVSGPSAAQFRAQSDAELRQELTAEATLLL